jgi:phosphopantothenoylcysteine decarboxylase/phosphopantothenate--cysteine ligase
MQDFLNKKILLGISGGVAAYKSAYLARELSRLGAIVRVVMTESAKQFVTPLLMQALTGHEVRHELFDSQAERAMGHIELARWADYLLIAPASANCLSKMAQGMADDLLSTLYLVATVPVVVCPAMNHSMWDHKATADNIATLKRRGVIIIGPEEGPQACGEYGLGRMSEVDTIVDTLRLVDIKPLLVGQRLLLTAGPTQESIDPVRYLSNHSSGKMGIALARAAKMAGAEVTLITGPTQCLIPSDIICHRVVNAQALHDSVMQSLTPGMIFIATAAVADFKIAYPELQKIKRQERTKVSLELTATPDILGAVVASKQAKYTVGFAAETEAVLERGREKFLRKQVDMLIANQVGEGFGFNEEENQVSLFTNDECITLDKMHKTRLAAQIIAILATKLQNGCRL